MGDGRGEGTGDGWLEWLGEGVGGPGDRSGDGPVPGLAVGLLVGRCDGTGEWRDCGPVGCRWPGPVPDCRPPGPDGCTARSWACVPNPDADTGSWVPSDWLVCGVIATMITQQVSTAAVPHATNSVPRRCRSIVTQMPFTPFWAFPRGRRLRQAGPRTELCALPSLDKARPPLC